MKDYNAEINAAVRELGRIACEQAREVCPVRTGRLRRSITNTQYHERAGDKLSVKIWTDVPYAAAVELGSGSRKPRHYLGSGAERAAYMAPVVFKIFLGGIGK